MKKIALLKETNEATDPNKWKSTNYLRRLKISTSKELRKMQNNTDN